MAIYKQSNNKLIRLKEKEVDLEKTIQSLTETNLFDIFGLIFVSSEFALKSLRMDTLAYDDETKSFVIIEFKRDQNTSVIDQGFAYLGLLLNNKADFVLEYNEKFHKDLRKDDIDWSQSKVIFISPNFTKFQREANTLRDVQIELWEVKTYDENIITFNHIIPSEKSESIKTVTKSRNIDSVSSELKQYTLDDHFKKHWKNSKELFDELSQRVLDIDPNFEIHPVKNYIGFNLDNKVLFAARVGKSRISLDLNRVEPKDLTDPDTRTRYRKNSFHYYHKHITQFDIKNDADIDYAVMLIKQIHKKFIEETQ